MSFHTNQRKRRPIPTARRHVYFYLLLFLGTVAIHGFWRGMHTPPPVRLAVEQFQEVVAKANQVK